MKILVVVSHPDDEVLGAGATIHKLVQEGHDVAVATMVSKAEARSNLSASLIDDQKKAFSILGVSKSYSANYPNIKTNIVPHLELVQFIERCLEDFDADVVITHHPSDVNIDHSITSNAAQVACRLSQRKNGLSKLKLVLLMEIPSSTDWSFSCSTSKFNPNYYVEIDKEGLDLKFEALRAYKGIMRSYPHPRSEESISGLAAFRGSQSGCNYAEAFECVFNKQ